MVFARNALAFGPGNAQDSIGLMPPWRKVKVGNYFPLPFLSPSGIHLPQGRRIAYNSEVSFSFIREAWEDGK
jgi:hypothetical protein